MTNLTEGKQKVTASVWEGAPEGTRILTYWGPRVIVRSNDSSLFYRYIAEQYDRRESRWSQNGFAGDTEDRVIARYEEVGPVTIVPQEEEKSVEYNVGDKVRFVVEGVVKPSITDDIIIIDKFAYSTAYATITVTEKALPEFPVGALYKTGFDQQVVQHVGDRKFKIITNWDGALPPTEYMDGGNPVKSTVWLSDLQKIEI